jgi:hypothetical protein
MDEEVAKQRVYSSGLLERIVRKIPGRRGLRVV